MGWTGVFATHYKNGKIDRKAECDGYFMEGGNSRYYEVLKSTMYGSTYYAAVKIKQEYVGEDENGKGIYRDLPEEKQTVFGAVFLTQTEKTNPREFFYKNLCDTEGPCYYDCPESILALLTPTENESANRWRKQCHILNAHKKRLKQLPENTKIRFASPYDMTSGVKEGEEVILEKVSAWGRTSWRHGRYIWKSKIPMDFSVV